MTATLLEDLIEEHRVLLDGYGRAQVRCSRLLALQAAEIERLQAQAIRLRGRAIVAETALAFAREAHAENAAALAIPGALRRRAMGRQIEALGQRIQDLMREVLHWQWRAVRPGALSPLLAEGPGAGSGAKAGSPQPPTNPAETAAMRSVVCIAPNADGSLVAQPVGGRQAAFGGAESPAVSAGSDAALEASLVAADFVICQTGCVGHDDYWRVQDHCKRTGKPCVLVDQPQVVQIMRGLAQPQDRLVPE
ncbi:DUF2325 domain-containing protein [Acidovorax sp. SUPP3334]|uniref:DUF2325 domain-containing protein n=1 Tax=Acidovorax sp. SUPP3334 TaxID=2920881 RepID=UPI0023DE2A21|nr:DUF2325 domain-containing protein [Acidovorax sp. SUPP3334]GKT23718.1 DUF2325 domain-containing protein [Acidovorax sp. SUPP3334]